MNTSEDPTLSQNPYVGPRSFTEKEHDRFYGRDREARDLLALASSERLVLFYAESGSGKSSLINARVIPGLRELGFEVLPIGRVGGEISGETGIDPDTISNIFIFNLILSISQELPTEESLEPASIVGLSLDQFLGGDEATLTPDASDAEQYMTPPHMLIIDQFEEILTTHVDRWNDRPGFFEQLRKAITRYPQLWVLLVMREDYLAGLDPYSHLLPSRLRSRFYMERMGREAAVEAVQKPAKDAGRLFLPEAADKLVKNLAQMRIPRQQSIVIGETVEPVQLQIVCHNLWKKLPPDTKEITEKDVETIGNTDQALKEFYESCLRDTMKETMETSVEAEEKLRNLFDNHLITSAGTRGMIFKEEQKGETGGIPNNAMEQLARMHLIREEWRSGSQWYELSHDRFIEPIRESNKAFHLNQADERAVESLIPLIGSDQLDISRGAITTLGQIGDRKAIDPLVRALQDQTEKIAMSAARALEKLNWEPANDHQKAWYFFAIKDWQASVELGLPSIEPLVSSLKNIDFTARAKAIETLGQIGNEQALEPLIDAFQDADPAVRKAAIQAIGKIHHQRAFQYLIDILQDKDNSIDRSIRLLALDTILILKENDILQALLKGYAENKNTQLTDEMKVTLSLVGLRDPVSP